METPTPAADGEVRAQEDYTPYTPVPTEAPPKPEDAHPAADPDQEPVDEE